MSFSTWPSTFCEPPAMLSMLSRLPCGQHAQSMHQAFTSVNTKEHMNDKLATAASHLAAAEPLHADMHVWN